MVLQQFGGLNGFAFYMNEIFELAGKTCDYNDAFI